LQQIEPKLHDLAKKQNLNQSTSRKRLTSFDVLPEATKDDDFFEVLEEPVISPPINQPHRIPSFQYVPIPIPIQMHQSASFRQTVTNPFTTTTFPVGNPYSPFQDMMNMTVNSTHMNIHMNPMPMPMHHMNLLGPQIHNLYPIQNINHLPNYAQMHQFHQMPQMHQMHQIPQMAANPAFNIFPQVPNTIDLTGQPIYKNLQPEVATQSATITELETSDCLHTKHYVEIVEGDKSQALVSFFQKLVLKKAFQQERIKAVVFTTAANSDTVADVLSKNLRNTSLEPIAITNVAAVVVRQQVLEYFRKTPDKVLVLGDDIFEDQLLSKSNLISEAFLNWHFHGSKSILSNYIKKR
jgi:hypothetical protein